MEFKCCYSHCEDKSKGALQLCIILQLLLSLGFGSSEDKVNEH